VGRLGKVTSCFSTTTPVRLKVWSVWIVFGQDGLVQTPNSNQQVNPFSISAFDTLSFSSSWLSYCHTRPFGRHESPSITIYISAQKMNGISHQFFSNTHTHSYTYAHNSSHTTVNLFYSNRLYVASCCTLHAASIYKNTVEWNSEGLGRYGYGARYVRRTTTIAVTATGCCSRSGVTIVF